MKLKLLTTLGSFGGGGIDPKPYEEEIARLSQEVVDLTEQVDACRVEIASLTADVAAKQAEIESLETEIAAKQARITELEQTTTEQAEEIERLQGQYADALEQIAQQQEAIILYHNQIDELSAQIEQINAELTDVQRQLVEAQEIIHVKQETIDTQAETIGHLTTELAEKTTALSEAQAEVARLQADVQTLTTQVTDLQAQVQTLSATITAKDLEIRQKDEYIAYLEEHQGGIQINPGQVLVQNTATGQPLVLFDAATVTDGQYAFYQNKRLNEWAIDLPAMGYGYDMFYACSNLTSFSGELASLKDGRNMFYGCSNLTSFSGNLSSLIDGESMFFNCSKLTSFDVDLPALTKGYYMFYGCSQLTSWTVDLPALTNGIYMFSSCTKLASFTGDLSALTSGRDMFYGNVLSKASVKRILTGINDLKSKGSSGSISIGYNKNDITTTEKSDLVTKFSRKGWTATFTANTPSATWAEPNPYTIYLPNLTDGTEKYESVNIFDNEKMYAPKLENGTEMFKDNGSLKTFEGDLPSLTNGYYMFFNCYSLTSFSGEMPVLTDGRYMFYACRDLTSFTGSLPSLTNCNHMFADCDRLTTFNCDLSNLTDGNYMFTESGLTSWDVALPALTNGGGMFYKCSNLTSWNVDLPALTNGTNMFSGCNKLTSFNGDLSSLTNGLMMFQQCESLTSWDVALPNLGTAQEMFSGSGLTSFNGSLASLTDGQEMFKGCKLDNASVQNIASTINDLSLTGGSGEITIGVEAGDVSEADIQNFNSIFSGKGWTVTWERKGAVETVDVYIDNWEEETRGVPMMPVEFDDWMMDLVRNPEEMLNLQSMIGDVGLYIKSLMGETYTMTLYDMNSGETIAEMNVEETNDTGPGNPRIWTFTDVQSDCSLTFTIYREQAQPNVIAGTMPSVGGGGTQFGFDLSKAMTAYFTKDNPVLKNQVWLTDTSDTSQTGIPVLIPGYALAGLVWEKPANVGITAEDWQMARTYYEDDENARYLVLLSQMPQEGGWSQEIMYVSPLKVVKSGWGPEGVTEDEGGWYTIEYEAVVPYDFGSTSGYNFANWAQGAGSRSYDFYSSTEWQSHYQNGGTSYVQCWVPDNPFSRYLVPSAQPIRNIAVNWDGLTPAENGTPFGEARLFTFLDPEMVIEGAYGASSRWTPRLTCKSLF